MKETGQSILSMSAFYPTTHPIVLTICLMRSSRDLS
jgi:hypothetical protein